MNDIIQEQISRYNPSNRAEYEQALRELLQELTLIGLWRAKFFEHAAFYGGTALRILYGLDRFSEDLDFTLIKPSAAFSWEKYAKAVVDELQSYGFNVNVSKKNKKNVSAIHSAFLKTNTIESLLKIGTNEANLKGIHSDALIRIKIEIDTNPPPGLHYEQRYTKHPFARSIRVVTKPDLFASKMHAALYRTWKNRVKGRDWWDVVWFIRQDTPINLKHIASCMQRDGELAQDEALTREKLLDVFTKHLQQLDIARAQEDIRPFIKDKSLVDEWSADFFLYWIQQLKVESF